jgi:hypothetical protein
LLRRNALGFLLDSASFVRHRVPCLLPLCSCTVDTCCNKEYCHLLGV